MPNKRIQQLFRCYEHQLRNKPQPIKNLKAIDSIIHCRTAEMGTNIYRCADEHTVVEQHHSCRHRSCDLCGDKSRRDWIEKQKSRLFNTAHFHVIFTLPHEYLSLWRYNERLMADLLFKASQSTLMTLIKEPQYQGVTPGILIALHTWGRQLNLHPHTHCLVTAGGLNRNARWQDSGRFLLPIRVVKQFYRGRFQTLLDQAFNDERLMLPPDMGRGEYRQLHKKAHQKTWSVRIEERYETGKGVMLYLSRYLRGGPLRGNQIEDAKADAIAFRYLDHRDKRKKQLRLSPAEFMRRLLEHVPPKGGHTIRHYGLYAGAARTQRKACQALLGTLSGESLPRSGQLENMLLLCPDCGAPLRLTSQRWRRLKAFSINKVERPRSGFVQQDDEADITNFLFNSS